MSRKENKRLNVQKHFNITSLFQSVYCEFPGNVSLAKCREYFFVSQFFGSVIPTKMQLLEKIGKWRRRSSLREAKSGQIWSLAK